MRIVAAFLAYGFFMPGANASSVLTPAPDELSDHPSIIAPNASFSFPSVVFVMPSEPAAMSSVIVMSEPGSVIESVGSAVVDDPSRTRRIESPMVIRGGIVGEAFVRAAPSVAALPAAPANTADAPSRPQPEPDATTTSAYEQPTATE